MTSFKSLIISAAIIAGIFIYLMYIVLDTARYFSFTEQLFSVLELVQFVAIFIGVVIDYFVRKLALRVRLVIAAAIIIIPGIVYKFLI